jgi:hypothetical protein
MQPQFDAETEALLNTISERMGLGPRGPKRDIRVPDPEHRGVVDSKYVRGSDVREFPKMLYRKEPKLQLGYATKVVHNQEEQDAAKGWLADAKDVHRLLESLAGVPEEVTEEPVEKQEKKRAKVA